MKPGKLTKPGFLGNDNRLLIDILNEDDQTVKSLGLTHEQIAKKLQEFMEAGKKGLGFPIKLNEFEIEVNENRGLIPCPFRHGFLARKTNVRLRNLNQGKEIVYSELSIHLINEHGFYQGKGSPFRLDPEETARFLGLI